MFDDSSATTRPLDRALLPVAAPGPALADCLGGMGPHALGDWDLIDVIAAWERMVSWATAAQAAAIAELAARRQELATDAMRGPIPTMMIGEYVVDELAVALNLTRAGASNRLAFALDVARLPEVGAALAAGRIDGRRAAVVGEAVRSLPDPTAREVAGWVLPRAENQTTGQLRASCTRAVLAVDPASAQIRHEAALAERRVTVRPLGDGMAELWAVLGADAAAAAYEAIDACARRSDSELGASMDARRADALVALCLGGRAPQVAVQVVVSGSTLLGLDDDPGELAGHGPIPAGLARRLAHGEDATWRRLLTDPTSGALLDVAAKTYRPPAALDRFVRTASPTCRFPTCRVPARRTDLDHVVAWPKGQTAWWNLVPLCRHHHRLKTLTTWQVRREPDGTLVWTTPSGHTALSPPPQIDPNCGPAPPEDPAA